MSASVCITGLGVVSPFGADLDAFRDRLLAGSCGVAPITHFALDGAHSRLGAEVTDFEATRWIPPMKLRRMDEAAQYAIVAVRQAFEDGAVALNEAGDDRAGVVLGTYTAGGHATADFLHAFLKSGPGSAPALLFNSTVANAAASAAGLELKLRGPNTTISQKEASGAAAITTAADLVRDDRAGALAAGGVDAIYEPFYRAHDTFRVYAPDAARPFDRARSGFVLGEGAYVALIEPCDAASARGARQYATILGIGAAGDSVPTNAWPSSPPAIRRTIALALEDAGLPADAVDVIFAAANGAPGLDDVEAEALHQTFGGRPLVTSIKGALGESGAASAAACVAACVCGRTGQVPAITGLVEPSAAAAKLRLARQTAALPGPVVLINSIASGGALTAILVRVQA